MDELTPFGVNRVAELNNGKIEYYLLCYKDGYEIKIPVSEEIISGGGLRIEVNIETSLARIEKLLDASAANKA